MEIPERLEVLGVAKPGDTVILRMPPEMYMENVNEFELQLERTSKEYGVKFVLLSNPIDIEIEGRE